MHHSKKITKQSLVLKTQIGWISTKPYKTRRIFFTHFPHASVHITNYLQPYLWNKNRMSTNSKTSLNKFCQYHHYRDTHYFKFHSTSLQIYNQCKYNSTEHVTVYISWFKCFKPHPLLPKQAQQARSHFLLIQKRCSALKQSCLEQMKYITIQKKLII